MAKKMNLTEKKMEELKDMLAKSREELRDIRFSATGARTKDTSARRNTRKHIARVLTEMTAKKRA